MHKKLLTTFLVLIMTPAGCTALVLGLSFLSFIDGHSSLYGKREPYEELADFLGYESADELDKIVRKRAKLGFFERNTMRRVGARVELRKMICEEVYRKQGKTVDELKADMPELFDYPDACRQSEFWALTRRR